jgi:hypothetical protein
MGFLDGHHAPCFVEPHKVLPSTTSNTSMGFECKLHIVILWPVQQSIVEYFINFQRLHFILILKLFIYSKYIEYGILLEAFEGSCNLMSF